VVALLTPIKILVLDQILLQELGQTINAVDGFLPGEIVVHHNAAPKMGILLSKVFVQKKPPELTVIIRRHVIGQKEIAHQIIIIIILVVQIQTETTIVKIVPSYVKRMEDVKDIGPQKAAVVIKVVIMTKIVALALLQEAHHKQILGLQDNRFFVTIVRIKIQIKIREEIQINP
jgi:hypothetical protein